MDPRLERLHGILQGVESALIAYSGGIDSLFLTKVAHDCLGKRVIALTAVSPSFPSYELEEAKCLAVSVGVRHLVVGSRELENPQYRANRGDRCFHCKTELYEICWEKAREFGIETVCNGTNRDDLGDFRPGLAAAEKWKVRSPLLEAGLTKQEIRKLAKEIGLPVWDKPPLACLSSRFPPGTEVTEDRLRRIDRIESGLKQLGFKNFRVRFHEPIARIEVGTGEIEKALEREVRSEISRLCHENGFRYAAIDLDGYQMGSVNPQWLSESPKK